MIVCLIDRHLCLFELLSERGVEATRFIGIILIQYAGEFPGNGVGRQ
jgi:hypothetical protein